jgi:lipopolysaccharide transport system ATP-binding protein
MSDPIIRVENVAKQYRLGTINHGTLKHDLQSWWARIRGKEDPNSPVTASSVQGPNEQFWALRDVSFDVQQGDVVGIIGRNGAGKSTLLKIISKVTAPTTGTVTIRGRVASLLEVGTGFHPELTGRENVYLNGAILGMSKREIRSKFDEIVAFAEIEQFIDTPVKRYSSGMYVRLAFAVAAHLEPEILIVDEVLAVGDMQFQKKCMGKMEAVGKDGRTILFVSHNIGAISRLCSRCVLLHRGRVLAEGATTEVIDRYLTANVVSSVVYQQDHDPKKAMNLRKVVLNPQRAAESNELAYDQPIRIRIEYEVNEPVSNCTVWMAIETGEGVNAFTSADHDQNLELLQGRMSGYYRTDIHIPGKWLNAGRYVIVVGIVKNRPLEVYDRVEALAFTMNEVGSPSSVLEVGTRRGVLQPILQWDHEKVG